MKGFQILKFFLPTPFAFPLILARFTGGERAWQHSPSHFPGRIDLVMYVSPMLNPSLIGKRKGTEKIRLSPFLFPFPSLYSYISTHRSWIFGCPISSFSSRCRCTQPRASTISNGIRSILQHHSHRSTSCPVHRFEMYSRNKFLDQEQNRRVGQTG